MAEEIGGIKIVIEAEDKASSTLSKISAKVGDFGKVSKTEAKSVDKVTASTDKVTASTKKYRQEMQLTEKSYKANKEALDKVRLAYNDTAKSTDNLIASKKQESKVYEQSNAALNKNTKSYSENTRSQRENTKSQKENKRNWEATGKSLKDFGDGLDGVTKPLQYATVGAVAGGVAVSKMAMDYETAFTKVKKTTNGSVEELEMLDKQFKSLSDTIPLSSTELAELGAVGGQLGVKTKDIAKFTESMAAMSVATNLAGEDGAATMARLMNVMGEDINNIDRVGSAIVDLGNNTATTEAEIATMAQRMGKYGKTVGMNTAQVLGYSAALSSLGVEAQLGGSAIGRTWLDIETAVGNGGEALQAYAKYAGTSAEEFASQWSTDPSGAFNGLIKGLSTAENLTGAMNDLGIVNTQDQQIIMALAGSYDLMTKSLNLSSNAYQSNTALMKEANTAYGTTANQMKLAVNDIQDAAVSWGDVLLPEISKGAKWVGSVAEGFESLDEGAKSFIISGAKTAVVLGGASKAAVGVVKGVGGIVEGVGSIKKAVSAGGTLAKLAPALTAAASAAGPVALGVAGVTAAVVLGTKAYKAYQTAGLRASQQLIVKTQELADSTSRYKELNDLEWEYKDLTVKISGGKLDGADLENAKARVEEIKKILSEKYKINVDYGDIEKSIALAKEMSRAQVVTQRSDLLSSINDYGEDKYVSLKNNIAECTEELNGYNEQMAEISKAQTAITKLTEEWEALSDEQKTIDAQNDFGNRLEEIMRGVPGFENYFADGAAMGTAFFNLASEFSVIEKSAEKLREEIGRDEETLGNFTKAAENLAQVGLAEISMGNTEEGFSDIALAIDKANLSANKYAIEAAKVQTKQQDLDKIFAEGGSALDKFVDSYMYSMEQLGASSGDIAVGAALLKNGFTDISQAASAGTLDTVSKQATELAQSMGKLDKEHEIKLSANGDVSLLDTASQKVTEVQSKSNVNVEVNSNGDITILDEATNRTQALSSLGAVSLSINAEGNIEVLDEAGEEMAEIDGTTGEVAVNGDYSGAEEIQQALDDSDELEDKDVSSKATGSYPGKSEIETALSHQNSLSDVSVTYTVNYEINGPVSTALGKIFKRSAKGTQNFEGGLAMVNDERGISDPRELIIDKGRVFIPQGRDVILPLSKGAKVYTASQTKAIMNNLGIPHYAGGKDNSEAYIDARDDWTHITNTRAVTVTEELEKWVELSKKFKSNINDINDIEEQIHSTTLKIRDEQNKASEDYIMARMVMNDWGSWGDDAVSAFNRVRDREYKFVEEGKITAKEADEYIVKLGEDMFDARVNNSDRWLEHEREYNNISVEDYIEGIDRKRAYTQQAFDEGMITTAKYYTAMQKYDDEEADARREASDKRVQSYFTNADLYYRKREAYGDWAEFGDSPEAYYKRVGKDIEAMYAAGDLSLDEYNERKTNNDIDLYYAQNDAIEEVFSNYRDYIDSVNERYDQLIAKKEKAFEAKNLKKELEDAQKVRDMYAGAVTQRGKEAYEQSLDDIEDISHQISINAHEEEQTAVIKELEGKLETAEKNKKYLLDKITVSGINIDGYVQALQTSGMTSVPNILEQILSKLNNQGPTNSYGSITQNIYADGAGIGSLVNDLTRPFRM